MRLVLLKSFKDFVGYITNVTEVPGHCGQLVCLLQLVDSWSEGILTGTRTKRWAWWLIQSSLDPSQNSLILN